MLYSDRARKGPFNDIYPSVEMLRLINGYQLTQAIHAAVQLGVPDQLKDGPRTIDELAALVNAQPRALYRLLRALAAAGILHEDDGRKFSLTPVGDCLRSDSPTPLGAWAAFVGRRYMGRLGATFCTVSGPETTPSSTCTESRSGNSVRSTPKKTRSSIGR